MSNSKMVMSQAANSWSGPTYIEDVFSTYLYTGNSSTQTITNGIDLAGEGGLVWTKRRDAVQSNILYDTERGIYKYLQSDQSGSQLSSTSSLTLFRADGFSLGFSAISNTSGGSYVSWTWRKAPRFFDCVQYTGTGSTQSINHNLGVLPGCIIVKRFDASYTDWAVYHRSNTTDPRTDYLWLNSLNATADSAAYWNDTNPTDTQFTVGTDPDVNDSGASYVAYLFAHDPLGPSGDGSDGLIACGSYTNDSNGKADINLGWEPQWLLVKRTNSTGSWFIFDTMRGLVTGGADERLIPNSTGAESAYDNYEVTATGFKDVGPNANGQFIYIAIRRGPMGQPTSGTEVFSVKNYAATSTSAEVTHDVTFDTEINANRDVSITKFLIRDSLRDINGKSLVTSSSGAETAAYPTYWSRKDQRTMYAISSFDGWWASSSASVNNHVSYGLVRAPGFFDAVAYSGDSTSNRAIPHNLGVQPELTIVKARSAVDNWFVTKPEWVPSAQGLRLNSTSALGSGYGWITGVSDPTDTNFYVSSNSAANGSGITYIMYHFATLAGVSKVGSYTGNGTNQTIDCGFTTGARFILIKRTNSTGDWYVWDTTRGIVAGNDPHLSLNTTAVEVTTDDTIDPDSSGFIVNQVSATNVNVSSASYIFLAIA